MTRHHRHHGNMVALTPTAVITHQQHPILEIMDLNPHTESVVLRVRERSGRVLYMYKESNPFNDLDTRGFNRGHVTDIYFMTVVSCSTVPIFGENNLLMTKRLLNYHSFPVKIPLNGKVFGVSNALLRTDRHL